MDDAVLEGGCQCGSVRYRASGVALMTAICHCAMCRRANAAPAVGWAMFRESDVIFAGTARTLYASSDSAIRGFCGRCGTQISFTADYIPGLVDLTIGSLDQPERVVPQLHCWHAERLPWAEFADGLPRHPGFPPQEEERQCAER